MEHSQMSAEQHYLAKAERIIREGEPDDDRTGVGTVEIFGDIQMRYDLRDGFPLLTSKKIYTKSVFGELAWMLHGDTNLKYLADRSIPIWNEWPFKAYLKKTKQTSLLDEQGSDAWNTEMDTFLENIRTDDTFASEHGELGPVYGHQWRAWQGADGKVIDQIANVQEQIRHIDEPEYKKFGRRLIVSAWNASDIEAMEHSGLPPCHTLFQFNVSNETDPDTRKRYLDLKLYQRSADWFLGVPFNMAQYALLLSLMAHTTGRTPRYFTHTFGSAHIYKNHFDQIGEQLARKNDLLPLPTLEIREGLRDITQFEPEDAKIIGYESHAPIRGQVAI